MPGASTIHSRVRFGHVSNPFSLPVRVAIDRHYLQDAGIAVIGLDALTGLPEYRNGGLLLDTGLLALRDPALASIPLAVDHAAVVEWRAATVVGLDRIAEAVRRDLGLTAAQFPLARVLEGGTWAAGRRLAVERRAGAAPPLQIDSDGTVF